MRPVTVKVTGPGGDDWTVRRSLLRGKDGRGRRWRWRGPDPGWLEALRLGEFAQFGEIPVIGVAILVVVGAIVLGIVGVFLPFVALALLEALLLGGLFATGLAAATLFGRPVLVRAERTDAAAPGEMYLWAVKGWSASRQLRDRVVGALRSGRDPLVAAGHEAAVAQPAGSRVAATDDG